MLAWKCDKTVSTCHSRVRTWGQIFRIQIKFRRPWRLNYNYRLGKQRQGSPKSGFQAGVAHSLNSMFEWATPLLWIRWKIQGELFLISTLSFYIYGHTCTYIYRHRRNTTYKKLMDKGKTWIIKCNINRLDIFFKLYI